MSHAFSDGSRAIECIIVPNEAATDDDQAFKDAREVDDATSTLLKDALLDNDSSKSFSSDDDEDVTNENEQSQGPGQVACQHPVEVPLPSPGDYSAMEEFKFAIQQANIRLGYTVCDKANRHEDETERLVYFLLRCSRYGSAPPSVKQPEKLMRNRISKKCACPYQVAVTLKHNVIKVSNEVAKHNHPPDMFGGKVRLKPLHLTESDREILRTLVAANASNERIRSKAKELFAKRLRLQNLTLHPRFIEMLRPKNTGQSIIDKGPEHIAQGTTQLFLQRAKDMLGACPVTNQRQEDLALSIEVREECRIINERIQASLRDVSASVACFVDAGERDKLLSVLDGLQRMPQAGTHGIHQLSVLDNTPSREKEQVSKKKPYQLYRARHKE